MECRDIADVYKRRKPQETSLSKLRLMRCFFSILELPINASALFCGYTVAVVAEK